MDVLTWFKSVFQRAHANPAPLPPDLATESWDDVPPLHVVAARLRPPPLPRDASPKGPSLPPPLPRQASAKAPSVPPPPRKASPGTPPRTPARQVPAASVAHPKAVRAGAPGDVKAKLDAVIRGGLKGPPVPRPAFVARRPAKEDSPTPVPLGTARHVAAPFVPPREAALSRLTQEDRPRPTFSRRG
jgi:hypothetical protein